MKFYLSFFICKAICHYYCPNKIRITEPTIITKEYLAISSHSNLVKQYLFHWYTSLATITRSEIEPSKIDTTSQQAKPIKSRLLNVSNFFQVIVFPPYINRLSSKLRRHQGMPIPPANTKDDMTRP